MGVPTSAAGRTCRRPAKSGSPAGPEADSTTARPSEGFALCPKGGGVPTPPPKAATCYAARQAPTSPRAGLAGAQGRGLATKPRPNAG